MVENRVNRKSLLGQYVYHLVPALEREKGTNVSQIKVLAPRCTIQRQHFQSFLGPTDAVKPSGQRSESFIISAGKTLRRVGHILLHARWIVPDAQLKG